MKYKIGQWVIVRSPIPGDVNKKGVKGQEIRIGFIYDFDFHEQKYLVQMLTTKDKENSNWVFNRLRGDPISARIYYARKIKESSILKRRNNDWTKRPDLSLEEVIEIRKLIDPSKYNDLLKRKRLIENELKIIENELMVLQGIINK